MPNIPQRKIDLMSPRGIAVAGAVVVALTVGAYLALDSSPNQIHDTTRPAAQSTSAKPLAPSVHPDLVKAPQMPPSTSRLKQPGNVNIDASVPAAMIASQIRQLQSEVQGGNAENAYQLFFLLNQCSKAAEDSKNFHISVSNGVKIEKATLDDLDQRAQECTSVPPDLIKRRLEFLDLAAATGDVRAQTEFGKYAPDDLKTPEDFVRNPEKVAQYKSKTMTYLSAAAEQGSSSAFEEIARALELNRQIMSRCCR
jgi:hypothetical protein